MSNQKVLCITVTAVTITAITLAVLATENRPFRSQSAHFLMKSPPSATYIEPQMDGYDAVLSRMDTKKLIYIYRLSKDDFRVSFRLLKDENCKIWVIRQDFNSPRA